MNLIRFHHDSRIIVWIMKSCYLTISLSSLLFSIATYRTCTVLATEQDISFSCFDGPKKWALSIEECSAYGIFQNSILKIPLWFCRIGIQRTTLWQRSSSSQQQRAKREATQRRHTHIYFLLLTEKSIHTINMLSAVSRSSLLLSTRFGRCSPLCR